MISMNAVPKRCCFAAVVSLALCAGAFGAERSLGVLRWSELQAAGKLNSGKVETHSSEGVSEQIIVVSDSDKPAVLPLAEIVNPGVNWPGYQLRGKIRYENVQGVGYLEMWSYFPDGAHYFTRTLGDAGPMARLSGTSAWRDIVLPFSLQSPGQSAPVAGPNRLVINLVLPGKGTVAVSPLEIVQLEDTPRAAAAWWSPAVAAWIGGATIALLGLGVGVVGIGSYLSGPRPVIYALVGAGSAVGAAVALVGLAGVVLGQASVVYLPLLFAGGLTIIMMAAAVRIVSQQSRQRELRRMQALDVI